MAGISNNPNSPRQRMINLMYLVFIAMMFLLSLIVFYVSRLTPGDPLQSFYGDEPLSITPPAETRS